MTTRFTLVREWLRSIAADLAALSSAGEFLLCDCDDRHPGVACAGPASNEP
jgi:hypothetical protein